MRAEQVIKAVTATATTGLSLLFGQVDTALTTLFAFMVIDIITGLLKAVYNENLSSEEMHRGAIKKGMKLMIVIVGVWMDKYTGSDIFRLGIIGFMIGTEGLSIFENVGQIIELPEFLSKYFEQLKNNKFDE